MEWCTLHCIIALTSPSDRLQYVSRQSRQVQAHIPVLPEVMTINEGLKSDHFEFMLLLGI